MNKTIQPQQEYEAARQKEVDPIYRSMGFIPDRSRACRVFDVELLKKGTDKKWKVEEKFRRKDWGEFGIEIMQDVFSENKGWYYKTNPDKVFHICPDNTIYSVDWRNFKAWFRRDYQQLKLSAFASVKGFGLTVNIGIKWKDIPPELYKVIDKSYTHGPKHQRRES